MLASSSAHLRMKRRWIAPCRVRGHFSGVVPPWVNLAIALHEFPAGNDREHDGREWNEKCKKDGMKVKLLMGTMILICVSCGDDNGRGERETHGNLQADPSFDGSQKKLIPGSRHPGEAHSGSEPETAH